MRKYLSILLIWTSTQGVIAQKNALDFDGSNDRVETSTASSLIAGSSLSITFWVRPTNTSGGPKGFAGIRNNSNDDFYILQLSPTSVEARFRNSTGTNYDIVSTGLTQNVWQHYAMTYNGSLLSLYRNGALVATKAATGSLGTSRSLHIGALPWGASWFWSDGRLDDISLWSKTLSATEISCIYDYGVDTSKAGLEIYYSCDQNKANKSNPGKTTLNDAMGNINGTLNGFSLSGTVSNWVTGHETHTYINGDICEGDSTLFGGAYRNTPGNHYTSYPVQSGCDSIVQLVLKVHAADTISKNHLICAGDSVEFNGQYLKDEGTYMQTFTSQFGCDSTSVKNIDVDSVNTEFTKGGQSLIAHAANALYQWYNCDGDSIIPGETNQTFNFTNHASYAVIVTQNNCTDTSECLYTALGVPEYAQSSIRLYPNPTSGDLFISGISTKTEVIFFDLRMRQVFTTAVNRNSTIDVSFLEPGSYFVNTKSNGNVQVTKLVIQ